MGSRGFLVALVLVLHKEDHHRHRLDRNLVLHIHHQVLVLHLHYVQPGLVQMPLQMLVLGLSHLV